MRIGKGSEIMGRHPFYFLFLAGRVGGRSPGRNRTTGANSWRYARNRKYLRCHHLERQKHVSSDASAARDAGQGVQFFSPFSNRFTTSFLSVAAALSRSALDKTSPLTLYVWAGEKKKMSSVLSSVRAASRRSCHLRQARVARGYSSSSGKRRPLCNLNWFVNNAPARDGLT